MLNAVAHIEVDMRQKVSLGQNHRACSSKGDGGFYFGGPSSVFAVAKQYKLPILVLLLDNAGWSAVKELTLRVFPEGVAKSEAACSRPNLMPDAEFSKIGEAFGAYGEKVTDPEEVPAALARAVKEVRGGARGDPARAGNEAVSARRARCR